MGTGGFSLGVKRLRREADHSPPSGAEVKECVDLYLHSPMSSWRGAQLKHRNNFTFTLPLPIRTRQRLAQTQNTKYLWKSSTTSGDITYGPTGPHYAFISCNLWKERIKTMSIKRPLQEDQYLSGDTERKLLNRVGERWVRRGLRYKYGCQGKVVPVLNLAPLHEYISLA
jgi:hypothetical protein